MSTGKSTEQSSVQSKFRLLVLNVEKGIVEFETVVSQKITRKGYTWTFITVPSRVVRDLGLKSGTKVRVRLEFAK